MPDKEQTIQEEAGLPENWVPVEKAAPIIPAAAGVTPLTVRSPLYQTNIAPVLQPDSAFQKSTSSAAPYPGTALMPFAINGIPSANAGIQSTAAKVSVPSVTNITNTTTGANDGLTHGDPVWVYDSAYNIIRDDFTVNPLGVASLGSSTLAPFGQLGWCLLGTPDQVVNLGGAPPNMGQLCWSQTNTLGQFGSILINAVGLLTNDAPATFSSNAWALLENPGWKLTWIFKLDGTMNSAAPHYAITKKSLYVGLSGPTIGTLSVQTAPGSPRPDVFMGLRYDTSVTPGVLTLSAAGNHSGNYTTYTMTSNAAGANNGFAGMTFTVAGFVTHVVNNGTFVCYGSTSTTLILGNNAGVSESIAATATGPTGIGDSTFKFEVVENFTYGTQYPRHNIQGTVFDTGVTPVKGTWYRLEIVCAATGQLTMTLNGAHSNTFTVPKMTVTSNGTGDATVNGGFAYLASVPWPSTSTPIPDLTMGVAPFTAGSLITVAGLTGTHNATLNGARGPLAGSYFTGGASGMAMYFDTLVADFTRDLTSDNFTTVGYPALLPFVSFGNDDTSSPTSDSAAIYVDYFAMVWNPNLGPNAPGTPTSTDPRYW